MIIPQVESDQRLHTGCPTMHGDQAQCQNSRSDNNYNSQSNAKSVKTLRKNYETIIGDHAWHWQKKDWTESFNWRIYEWSIKPFCFPWIAFKRTIPTTTTKSSNENDQSCRHNYWFAHYKINNTSTRSTLGNSNIFSAVYKVCSRGAKGRGLSVYLHKYYTYIQTGGSLTSQVWGSPQLQKYPTKMLSKGFEHW